MLQFEILLAQESDIEGMARLLAVLFGQESEFSGDLQLQKAGLHKIIENNDIGQLFVVKHHGKIVGMVSLLYSISTALGGKVAILEDMIIDSDFRGKGVGSLLIKYAIEYAKLNGCLRATLLTDGDNYTAHKFYSNHGFKKSEMVVFRRVF